MKKRLKKTTAKHKKMLLPVLAPLLLLILLSFFIIYQVVAEEKSRHTLARRHDDLPGINFSGILSNIMLRIDRPQLSDIITGIKEIQLFEPAELAVASDKLALAADKLTVAAIVAAEQTEAAEAAVGKGRARTAARTAAAKGIPVEEAMAALDTAAADILNPVMETGRIGAERNIRGHREVRDDILHRMTPTEAGQWALKQLPGNYTFIFSLYDFETGARTDYGGNREIFPASMIKVLYLLSFLEEVNRENHYLTDEYILTDYDQFTDGGMTRVAGMGELQHSVAGSVYTVDQLLELMIARSDNVATNIIIRKLTFALLNEYAAWFGLYNTGAHRFMYERNAAGLRNYSTMNDLVNMLITLANKNALQGYPYSRGIKYMMQSDNHRIGKYPPPGVRVANKIGNTSSLVSDMALIYYEGRSPVALSVMIFRPDGNNLNKAYADEIIAQFSELIMEYFVHIPVKHVDLSIDQKTMDVGDALQIESFIRPYTATDKGLAWHSGNPEVAVVNCSGKVTALAAGKTVITASSNCGGKAASCRITVPDRQPVIDFINKRYAELTTIGIGGNEY